ncbi:MAG: RagB/SusD family nutrient uptake outer membrane protein [Tannerella sp.]|jgi:hypothetical protein|nr:RagB/SusD family nutrient uptake outer membrane protein [Tannerella sp.]
MKKYILFLFTAFAVSCNDMLELQNDGRISMEQVFKTRAGVQGYLNSCYGYRIGPSLERSALTDDAHHSEDMFGGSLYNRWYANANSAAAYANVDFPWTHLYNGIRKCNIFISNVSVLDPSSILNYGGEISSWLAEARTLRAYYYLELIKRYGACPIITQAYETTHNFGADRRAKVSEVVQQIVADCDEALAAPEQEQGFPWRVMTGQNGIMTRAMAHAIKSQAVLFAASPLYSDGTYSWADARTVTAAALGECLAHGYELFNTQPDASIAQNTYAYYFINYHDEQQAFDKETVYPGHGLSIWQSSGLPTTAGQTTAGVCPTQELVDCYEMANGEAPITGYTDEQHLNPIINPASGYDPANPYAGRDPRFYASIYFNGAVRQLGEPGLGRDDHYPISLNTGELNQINVTENGDEFRLEATGGDPFINTTAIGADLKAPPGSVYFRMEYKAPQDINTGEFFFCMPNAAGGIETGQVLKFPKAADWTAIEIELTSWCTQFGWGKAADHRLRFDFATEAGHVIEIRNMEIVVQSTIAPAAPVETFVGGSEAISGSDRRYTRTGYYLRKYNNWKSNKDNSADGELRKIRLAELYLNFAEAANQADGPDNAVNMGNGLSLSARDAVNAVRKRAGMPDFPSGMTKDGFDKKYRNERRIELAFDDNRYFDVRRWKIMEETSHYVTGMRITANEDGQPVSYQRFAIERLAYGEKYYFYPLEMTEANKMQNHTGNDWQNPGW